MIRTPLAVALGTATVVAMAMTAGPANAAGGPAQPAVVADPAGLAAASASALVASRPAYLHAGPGDAFVQRAAVSSAGLHYTPFERTYKGLPVRGGDFVVVTDSAGATKYTSVAQT